MSGTLADRLNALMRKIGEGRMSCELTPSENGLLPLLDRQGRISFDCTGDDWWIEPVSKPRPKRVHVELPVDPPF